MDLLHLFCDKFKKKLHVRNSTTSNIDYNHKEFCNNLTDLFYVKDKSVILFFLIIVFLDSFIFLWADCTWKIYFQETKSKEIHNSLFSLKAKWNISVNFLLGLAIGQGK
jgi:hypothetical protein